MINAIVINQNQLLIDRIKPILSIDDNIAFRYYTNIEEAIDFISENHPEIGILSLDMDIMGGDEIADIIIDNNDKAKFVFIYEESNIEKAIELFNRFDYTRLIENKGLSPDDLLDNVRDLYELVTREDNLNQKVNSYRDLEKASRDKMSDMSSVLNSRIECYNSLNRSTVNAIKFICGNDLIDYQEKVINYLNYTFAQYIHDLLIESPDIVQSINTITEILNDTQRQRHFQFVSDISVIDKEIEEKVSFAAFVLSHMFSDFLEKYRIKIELKENDKIVRMDFLLDKRLGNIDDGLFDMLRGVARRLINSICDKVEFASNEGIIQYRMFFIKKNEAKGQMI